MLTLSFHRLQLPRTRRASTIRAVHGTTTITPITLSLHWRTIYQHPRFPSPRYLSTPSSTASKPSKDEPGAHAIPPVPHKTKVELRPGPIKPLTVPPGSRSEKMKQVATKSAPSLQPTSPTAGRTESVAETPRDSKRTYIHGVLASPPPDAGKIAKLWHQVKELFVSRASQAALCRH